MINKIIKVFLDNDEVRLKNKDKKKSSMTNVLDYYGKTGEFAIRVARMTRCTVTYVDQRPWYDYAKFRFRVHNVTTKVKSIEATPTEPRPEISSDKYSLISSLEVPIECTQDWLDWAARHLIPFGLIACRAEMPWKKIAKLDHFGFIYQYTPTL
jgi:hypothetical protein